MSLRSDQKYTELVVSKSVGQLRLSSLKAKLVEQHCDGLDMCTGEIHYTKNVKYGGAKEWEKRKTT